MNITDLYIRAKANSTSGSTPMPAAELGNSDFSIVYGAFRLTSVQSTPQHIRRVLADNGFVLDIDDGKPGSLAAVDAAAQIQRHILLAMDWD